jgi:hypothetical protein
LRCAAACALLAAAPAWAASSASLAAAPIQVQLLDLRPDDGIAPAIEFHLQGFEAGAAAVAGDSWPPEFEQRALYGSWEGTARTASTRHAFASSSVAGGASDHPGGTTVSLQGSAIDFAGPADASARFGAQAVLAQGAMAGFTLSPWTAIVMSMDVSARLATTHANDIASANFDLRFMDVDHNQQLLDTFTLDCAGTCSVADGRAVSLTFLNESAASLGGFWSVYSNVIGTSFTSAVPEPGPGTLWLCGIGLLGYVARRHAHHATDAR